MQGTEGRGSSGWALKCPGSFVGEGCGEGICIRYVDVLSSWWLGRKDQCWVVPGAFEVCSGVTPWSVWIVSFLVRCGSRVVLEDVQILGAKPFLGRRHREVCLQQAYLPMQMVQKDKYKPSGFLCNTKLMDRSFWSRKILTTTTKKNKKQNHSFLYSSLASKNCRRTLISMWYFIFPASLIAKY